MAAPNKTSKLISSRLPPKLILEIFSYLPTKSLRRLRYVFDDAKSLKTNSLFQHKHASNVLTNPSSAIFLMEAENFDYMIHEIDSYPFKPPSITHSYNFKQLFTKILPYDSKDFWGGAVIGELNGLICLHFEFYPKLKIINENECPCYITSDRSQHFILWNPCTGEHHAIPSPQRFRSQLFEEELWIQKELAIITIFGFGYDLINKTYKLVMGKGAITQIYDLSTDAWKIVETIDINWVTPGYYHAELQPKFGYYLNGALHWMVYNESIVSIDLSTEVSSFLNMPYCCSNDEVDHRLNIGIMKGCLSISCYRFMDNEVSIWVMKEYGRDDSWTNLLNISLRETDVNPSSSEIMTMRPPLWVSQEDEMLFLIEGRLAYWDPKAEVFNYVEGLNFHPDFRGIVHFDTIVSPNPEVYRLGGGQSGDNGEVLVSK